MASASSALCLKLNWIPSPAYRRYARPFVDCRQFEIAYFVKAIKEKSKLYQITKIMVFQQITGLSIIGVSNFILIPTTVVKGNDWLVRLS